MLFIGEDGMGKETLAKFITKKMNSRITSVSSQSMSRAGDFIGLLTNLGDKDILFISEIEKFNRACIEFLLPAMSRYHIDFIVDKGPYAKNIEFTLKPFTLIATSSHLNKINKKLLPYFLINYNFEPYLDCQIGQIIQNKAKSNNLAIDLELLKDISQNSYGSPADVMTILNKAIIYANSFGIKVLNKEVIEETIKISGHQTIFDTKKIDRAISDEVRLKVWRRDEGKCVKCGCQEKLEYDHIIPVSKGGSNTERNIQLLCEKCNRSKSANI